jgi:hypothetical protein
MTRMSDPRASHYYGLAEDADRGASPAHNASRFSGSLGRCFLETKPALPLGRPEVRVPYPGGRGLLGRADRRMSSA